MADDPDDSDPKKPSRLRRLGRKILGRVFHSSFGQDLRGGSHALEYLRHLARGNKVDRRLYDTVTEDRPPVLLIHGFLGTRGSMWPLEQRLRADGFVVFSFNLGTFNTRDIRTSSFLIHKKIEAIAAQTGVRRIDIVGHSMGGLIGLYYIKKLQGADRVRRLVAMGTPIKGTWAALMGVVTVGLYSASAWQLLPGSDFLRELAEGPMPETVDITTIFAVRDWVCPPASTPMAGAAQVRVPLGHAGLVVSESVYLAIREALRR
jgi:pimeloyl-ACP methyl ester carboxylesterase